MLHNFINRAINTKICWKLFITLLLISNASFLMAYPFLDFTLFNSPFQTVSEIFTLLILSAIAAVFATGISLLLWLIEFAGSFAGRNQQLIIPAYAKTVSLAFLAIGIILNACNVGIRAGVKKDFNTGLTSTYNGIEPGKVLLVMNDEVLNHTNIPLGESFLLVNDNVEGLQAKDGKVTIGCSLMISGQKGEILLNEKDLFEGKDQFVEKDAKMLKCTISTGLPMKWEEKYNVAVVFWDKNGTGKIENNFTIRTIDIP